MSTDHSAPNHPVSEPKNPNGGARDGQPPSPAEMYEDYFVPSIFIPWTRVLLEHAAPQPGEHVLDLACGTGVVARHVAPMVGPTGKVIGLDISSDMLAVARSLPAPDGATIEWREGDAAALNLPNNAFDLVLCQQGLQFFPDRAAAVQAMRRVLKANGRVVLKVWQALHHHPVYKALLEAEARHLGAPLEEVASPFFFGSGETLRALLDEAGFQHIAIVPKTLDVRFPSPDRFIELTVLAGAAVIPEFAEEDPAARSELIEAIRREADPVIQQYRNGDKLAFPMPAHIATAYV